MDSSDNGLLPLTGRHLNSWVWAGDSNDCEYRPGESPDYINREKCGSSQPSLSNSPFHVEF